MGRPRPDPLETQLDRVRRRLFLRGLGRGVLWCWAVLPLLAAGVLLVLCRAHLRDQPHSATSGVFLGRLAVAGAVLFAASLIVAVVAWLRRPSRLSAALTLDRTLGLGERL